MINTLVIQVISEDRGLTLEKVQLETLGTAKKVCMLLNGTFNLCF